MLGGWVMGLRTETLTKGPKKGETVIIDPPHLEPSDPRDQERMRTHWENGWSFFVGSELYVLMDYQERGRIYQRKGPRSPFDIPLGKPQDIFKSQLSTPSKSKVKRDKAADKRRSEKKSGGKKE